MTEVTAHEIEKRFERSQNDLVLQTSDFSLQGLRDMVDNEVIDLNPRYQRRERWNAAQQSELIESFLLNVPVPPVYLAEEQYGVYSIIDGKQRITAISEFLSNAFSLRGLENFKKINGARFKELPKSLQNALRVRPYLRVITLLKQSDPLVKYEVFMRLNRGGIRLNNQEIRNTAFRGSLNDSIYQCAENHLLQKALKIDGPKSSAFQQMLDAEYVLRFLTLRESWKTFSGSLSKSMDQFMIKNQNADGDDLERLTAPFGEAIDRVEKIWGEVAFNRWDGERWRQQALAGLYDAQMISASTLSNQQVVKLSENSNQVLETMQNLFEDSEFEESVRLGTNTPSRLRHRVLAMLEMLERI